MTKDELKDAIENTIVQERLFREAGDDLNCAHWILERVKLRAMLYSRLMEEIR